MTEHDNNRLALSRRSLLTSGGMTLFAAASGVMPMFMNNAALAASVTSGKKVLVVVFQRFGMDGLMAVAPFGDAHLTKLRPGLMLPRPGQGDSSRVDLDGQFGLHPSMSALESLYRQGDLAIVHAAGSPHNTRSHGEAQMWWESGTPGDVTSTDGWLNRAASSASGVGGSLRAISLTRERPRTLYGEHPVSSMESLEALVMSASDIAEDGAMMSSLQQMYRTSGNDLLRHAGADSFDAVRILQSAQRQAGEGKNYPPGSPFGRSLREIAHLIKLGVGLRVAFAESRTDVSGKGTWDSHSNQAALDGPFSLMGRDFSQSLAAFWEDLGEWREDVALVTMTDFGRNVVQNVAMGTDHGRATATFVLGGAVKGGKVYGSLPERFELDALEDQMDLPVTTDYRSVMAALTGAQLGIRTDAAVFPGWNGRRMDLTT